MKAEFQSRDPSLEKVTLTKQVARPSFDKSKHEEWNTVSRSKKKSGVKEKDKPDERAAAKAPPKSMPNLHLWKDPRKPDAVGSYSATCAKIQKVEAQSPTGGSGCSSSRGNQTYDFCP